MSDDWDFNERVVLLMDKIDRDIAISDMSVISVMGDTPFAYTVGLWSNGSPELIVCGLHPDIAHAVLTSAHQAMKKKLLKVANGVESNDVLDHYPVRFEEVPYPNYPLNIARRFHRTDDFPSFQLIWPDKEGRFPGDDGYALGNRQDLPQQHDSDGS